MQCSSLVMDHDDEDHISYCALQFAIVSAEATIAEIAIWVSNWDKELEALQGDDGSDETYESDLLVFQDELERLEVEAESDDLNWLELEDELNELEELEELEQIEPENGHGNVDHQDTVLDSFQLLAEIEKWRRQNDMALVDHDGSDEENDMEVLKDEFELLELELELDDHKESEHEPELDELAMLEPESELDEFELLELELELDETEGLELEPDFYELEMLEIELELDELYGNSPQGS